MEPLHLAHLILVSAWGGLVIAESVMELTASSASARAMVARAHYFIDLWAELPLLVAVLATGTILSLRAWPLTPLHWIKIGCALVAIALNLSCVVLVVARHRSSSEEMIARYSGHIRWVGAGIPFAVAAAWIGLGYFRG